MNRTADTSKMQELIFSRVLKTQIFSMEVTQYYVAQNIDFKHNITVLHQTPHIIQETTKCQKYEVQTEKGGGRKKERRIYFNKIQQHLELVLTKF
jgi:hypothetical protein